MAMYRMCIGICTMGIRLGCRGRATAPRRACPPAHPPTWAPACPSSGGPAIPHAVAMTGPFSADEDLERGSPDPNQLTRRLDHLSAHGVVALRDVDASGCWGKGQEGALETEIDSDEELRLAKAAADRWAGMRAALRQLPALAEANPATQSLLGVRREITNNKLDPDYHEATALIKTIEEIAQDFGLRFAFFGAVKVFLILALISGDTSFIVFVILHLRIPLWLGFLIIAVFNLVAGMVFLIIATKYKSWEEKKKRREMAKDALAMVRPPGAVWEGQARACTWSRQARCLMGRAPHLIRGHVLSGPRSTAPHLVSASRAEASVGGGADDDRHGAAGAPPPGRHVRLARAEHGAGAGGGGPAPVAGEGAAGERATPGQHGAAEHRQDRAGHGEPAGAGAGVVRRHVRERRRRWG